MIEKEVIRLKVLARIVLPWIGLGVFVAVLALILPGHLFGESWKQTLFFSISMKDVVLGGAIGLVWAFLTSRPRKATSLLWGMVAGVFLWDLVDAGRWIWLAVPAVILMVGGWIEADKITKVYEKMTDYAKRAESLGDQKKQLIRELYDFVVKAVDKPIRLAAARCLKMFGGEGTQVLVDNLQNTDPSVRQRLVVALGTIGTVDAIPSLQKLLQSEHDRRVRNTVTMAISEIEASHRL